MASSPTNSEIAAAFDELGDLHELDGASIHRIVAYRNGARAVREASKQVAQLALDGQATALPGIGARLQEKIVALTTTGEIPALVKLRGKFPPGLVEMTKLPGLGPKRARRLYEELGIDSLDALCRRPRRRAGSASSRDSAPRPRRRCSNRWPRTHRRARRSG